MYFRIAKILVDLAITIDKTNKELREKSLQVKKVQVLVSEFERAIKEVRVFALVLLHGMEWFADEFEFYEGERDGFAMVFGPAEWEMMQTMEYEYVVGITTLKRRYPAIYDYFAPRWQELYKAKTVGMNRDERRSLRY